MSAVHYRVTSKYMDPEPLVGILPLEVHAAVPDNGRIPIKVNKEAVSKWTSTPAQIVGGPTHLAAYPLNYTTEEDGKVYATNDPGLDKVWFLLPANEVNTYAIGIDEGIKNVWTEVNGEIKIEPFMAGNSRQVFEIVQI